MKSSDGTRSRGQLAQAWQGTVTERLDAGFRAVVESRLWVKGETDVAELSDALINENERIRIREGVRFDWIVFGGTSTQSANRN